MQQRKFNGHYKLKRVVGGKLQMIFVIYFLINWKKKRAWGSITLTNMSCYFCRNLPINK